MKTLRLLTIFGLTLSSIAVSYTVVEYLASTIGLPDYEMLRMTEVTSLSKIPELTNGCDNKELIHLAVENIMKSGKIRHDELASTNKWNELTAIIRILLWGGAGTIFYILQKRIKTIENRLGSE